ncbi:MAG: TRAP transporter large permease [Eubacteriales bacterium]|nr:TRAP transporter large permease [Eubacteriales bacterium]
MNIALIVAIIIFALAFILKMPIALGMIASGAFYFLLSDIRLGLQQVANAMGNTIFSSYVLIAVPLFILSANIMNSGQITNMIFKFANALVGRRHGGLGHVNVLASLIFSGMTGSAIADASGLGKMEIQAMREAGYDDAFSCAITAASATIGPIFPPSIPLIIYAMYSNTSVGDLFLGGTLPGVMIALALAVYVAIVAKKRNYPRGEKMLLRDFIFFTLKALPALLTPVILLIGIYTGVMTPTEAGAVAGIYALLISVVFYRSVGLKEFIAVIKQSVIDVGGISIMVAAASIISYIVAREQIAVTLGNWVLSITDSKWVFITLSSILILILGMFVDTSVIQFIFIPILLPLAIQLDVNLIHFGVLTTLNMMVGLSTPPFGMLLFITSNISGTDLKSIIKENWYPLAAMFIVLLLVTYVPAFSTLIPSLLK